MSRKEFLGVYVTDDQKAELVAEAERRGMSMSMLTTEKIKDLLITLGHDIKEAPTEDDAA